MTQKSFPRSALLFMLLAISGPLCAEPLRRGLGPEPDSLDIHQAQGLAALQVLRDINEGLVTFDVDGQLTAGVAESWEVSDDGLTWTFTLRQDARWSDGSQLVAGDFVRGWQLALAPARQARTAGLLAAVKNAGPVMTGALSPAQLGISAVSDRELQIELDQFSPWFAEILAHPVAFPLAADSPERVDQRKVNGAYRISESVPHAYIRMEKNPEYHSAAQTRLDTIEYLPIEDPGSELSRYRADEIDITETIPPGRYAWLQEHFPGELRISPYVASFWLGLNVSREPFRDSVDLRRALSLAIDRETLTRVVTGAGEIPAFSVVPPGLPGYQPQADHSHSLTQAKRAERARKLYARTGYTREEPLRVQLRFNTSTQHRRMAVAVAAMWKQELGVQTELLHEEWKVFVNNRRQGALTQVFRGGWIADYADPASFLELFRSEDPLNTTFYSNPDYDRLLDTAAKHRSGQRMQLLQQAETLLMRDMPVIPLYYYVSRHLVKPDVGGFHDNARDVHLSRYLYRIDE